VPIVDHDAGDGLQRERTRLAWRRTTLAVTVVTLLGVSRVLVGGVRPPTVIGLALAALVWLAVIVVAHRRIRALTERSTSDGASRLGQPDAVRLAAAAPGDHRAARGAPAALALLTAALALVSALLLD
jgi:hypothetical protein